MTAARAIDLTRVDEWKDGTVHSLQDYLVAEEPLEIRVNGNPLTVTMRTPGHDAAELFDGNGELIVLREDIGRHNAVDKVIGWAVQQNKLPLSDCAMMVSGRGGFEIIQKALAAGLPLLASVSAPSGLAVQLAREYDMTLIGFLRGRRFVIYSAPSRIRQS